MSEVSYTLSLGEESTSSCHFDGTLAGLSSAVESVKNQINTLISNKMNTNGATVVSADVLNEGDISEDSSDEELIDSKRCRTTGDVP